MEGSLAGMLVRQAVERHQFLPCSDSNSEDLPMSFVHCSVLLLQLVQ